jgi:hypothetical protein
MARELKPIPICFCHTIGKPDSGQSADQPRSREMPSCLGPIQLGQARSADSTATTECISGQLTAVNKTTRIQRKQLRCVDRIILLKLYSWFFGHMLANSLQLLNLLETYSLFSGLGGTARKRLSKVPSFKFQIDTAPSKQPVQMRPPDRSQVIDKTESG